LTDENYSLYPSELAPTGRARSLSVLLSVLCVLINYLVWSAVKRQMHLMYTHDWLTVYCNHRSTASKPKYVSDGWENNNTFHCHCTVSELES